MLYFQASLFSKIIWGVSLFVALVTWLYGRHQKSIARYLEKIIKEDFARFGKTI